MGFPYDVAKNAPCACGNVHTCAFTRFQKPQQVGRARTACSSIVTCSARRAQSQRPALLQAAAETTTGKEDLKAVRRVRHCKEVGLQEWPLAGRATVPCVLLYTVSVSACLFVGGRFFQNVYGRPLASPSPFTLFARLTEPQVVVLFGKR